MKTLKLNFTVPADVADELKTHVAKRKRSAFVTEALKAKLEAVKKEHLLCELAEGYQARNSENAELAQEWDNSAADKWL